MAKKFDPKAKAKRDKVVAAGAGVVLLGVLAITVPMTMKMMKSPDASSSSPATTPAATTPAAPGAVPPAPTAVPADLVSATGAPAPSLSQLGALSRFASKDPFSQQVTPNGGAGPTGAPPAGRSPRTGASPAGVPFVPSATGASPTGRASGAGGPATTAPPSSAVISVNGGPPQQISLDQDFPQPPFEPMFHLVSLARRAAKVSIVGGSYATGAATVTLRVGRPLTLMNTADGTRYVLRLLWLGAGAPPKGLLPPAPQPNSPTATTPGAATPPTASPPPASAP